MYDRHTFRTLLTPHGQEVLRAAASVPEGLRGLTALRRRAAPDLATLAHLTVGLRRRAGPRFTRAGAMYFLPEALEQATREVVARHKARRYASLPRVLDLGCGIGGDLIGLARVTEVDAFDSDGLRLDMARENLDAYELGARARFHHEDFTAALRPAAAFHWDPSRRAHGVRTRRGRRFAPPLSFLRTLLEKVPDGGVCLGPATPERELHGLGPGEIETVSVAGECLAMILWTGALRSAARRATLLPGGECLTGEGGLGPAEVTTRPRRYLVLPDPAVVRAHLVGELAARLGAWLLDPHLAVLTAEQPGGSPWTRSFRVVADFPFSRARLRRELAARGLRHVVLSLHGVPAEAGRPARARSPGGVPEARVFLVRRRAGPAAIITDLTPETEAQEWPTAGPPPGRGTRARSGPPADAVRQRAGGEEE